MFSGVILYYPMSESEKTHIVNDHILANKRGYEVICGRLYKDRYLADDLFQEFYLAFISLPKHKIEKYRDVLFKLGGHLIRQIFGKRNRKSSPLREDSMVDEQQTELKDDFEDDFEDDCKDDCKDNLGGKQASLVEKAIFHNYVANLEDEQTPYFKLKYLEKVYEALDKKIAEKLNSQHDFLEVAVFLQGQQESIRSIERKTKISRNSLLKYYEAGRQELKKTIDLYQ